MESVGVQDRNNTNIQTGIIPCYGSTLMPLILNWSPQKGTRVAVKLPTNAEDKCEECFFQMLVVSFDQIGNFILPSSGSTFAEHGSQQVDIIAKDKKRAYTLLVASTPDGTFLPFQQVWDGASEHSLPSRNASGMTEAREQGFDFAFVKSRKKRNHFSTLKTMKEWVENIFEPYRCSVIKADPLPDNEQVCIIYLDCYPVHADQDFRTYIADGFSYIILCFVPARCMFQLSISVPAFFNLLMLG
ncbi:hypothetical protein HD554DRAFT_2203156 [Boletus coccyginus]|nr:hypothetical protein HD554DRAFT_2203156 [Boletus coccyginus]